MVMKKNVILALMAVLGMTLSCKSPEVAEPQPEEQEPVQVQIDEAKVAAFVETSDYGVYNAEVAALFVFNKKEHEAVWNTKASRFVIQDDYQKALLTVVLKPAAQEAYYSVEITAQTEGVTAGTYTMKMVKSEGETAWLWEVENKFGLVILQ